MNIDIVIKETNNKRYFYINNKLHCIRSINLIEEEAITKWKEEQLNKLLFGSLDNNLSEEEISEIKSYK